MQICMDVRSYFSSVFCCRSDVKTDGALGNTVGRKRLMRFRESAGE